MQIGTGEGGLVEGHAEGARLVGAARLGGDDRDPLLGHVDVPEDQRQHALADRAEADDDEAAVEGDVLH